MILTGQSDDYDHIVNLIGIEYSVDEQFNKDTCVTNRSVLGVWTSVGLFQLMYYHDHFRPVIKCNSIGGLVGEKCYGAAVLGKADAVPNEVCYAKKSEQCEEGCFVL